MTNDAIEASDATPVAPEGEARPTLERRVAAASVDGVIVGACCGVMFLCFGPVWTLPYRWLWVSATVVLAVYFFCEALRGVTPGKWVTRLSVRRWDGGRPEVARLAGRAIVKMLPPGMFVGALFVGDHLTGVMAQWASILVIVVYVQVCYVLFMRDVGKTIFDLAAGTRVERRQLI